MSETTSKISANVEPKPLLMKLKKLKPLANPALAQKKATFVCVLCRAGFMNHLSLKEHFKNHAKTPIDNSTSQTIRGKKDATTDTTTTPTLISGPIPCEFCPLILLNLSKAIQHKYRKHRFEGKNHFCEFCGRLFPIRVALEQHKESNHSTEMLSTKSSDAASSSTRKLNSARTATAPTSQSNTSLTCKFCSVTFLTTVALEFHENGVHKFEQNLLVPIFIPPPSTKIKMNNNSEVFSVYYCYLCGSEYIMKYNLKKHLQDHHTAEERDRPPQDGLIRCKTCDAIFYTKRAYEAHAVHHRPDDLYVTSEEHRRQVVHRVDQDFDFRRVPQDLICIPKIKRYIQKRKVRQDDSNTAKAAKISDDESLSPPPSVSNSSDEEEGVDAVK